MGRVSFAIENARPFPNTGFQPVSPLTLLVGENSSGKTSFFSLLYESISYFGFFQNQYFDLGPFSEIVHRSSLRPQKKGYRVSYNIEGEFTALSELIGRPVDNLGLSISYEESRGNRVAREVALGFLGQSATFSKYKEGLRLRYDLDAGKGHLDISSGESILAPSEFLSNAWGLMTCFMAIERYDPEAKTAGGRLSVQPPRGTGWADAKPLLVALGRVFQQTIEELSWIVTPTTAMRSEPKRVYTSSARDSEDEETPFKLYRIQQYEPALWTEVRNGLRAFGRSSGLFDDIEVRSLRGKRRAGPFEIIIKRGNVESNLVDVGYGISQVMPFVSDILIENAENKLNRSSRRRVFYVQQPETHLHPSAQAAIGSFFFDLAINQECTVVLETHSDFIIDRIRQHVRKCGIDCEDRVTMLFFENSGGASTVYPVKFDAFGNVLGAPETYREFFIREELRNLGVLDVSDN